MQGILSLQKKIVPELIEVLEKRYDIIKTILYNQPIGRRLLATELNLGERVIRTEIDVLKSQGLININSAGMSVTKQGEYIIENLKDFIKEIKGLYNMEERISQILEFKKVIIVPGDCDENPIVMKEIGKAAANYMKNIIEDNNIIAVTGGSTIKELVEAFPQINTLNNILVVPARGGMGRNVESQSNTLAANLAQKLNASYKLLHIPENVSNEILDSLLKESQTKEVIDKANSADILIYGISNAIQMAKKRGASKEQILKLQDVNAIGEALGCYFNKNSQVINTNTLCGMNIDNLKKVSTHIAVAAGQNKVDAIIVTKVNNKNSILVTDEATSSKILKIIDKN